MSTKVYLTPNAPITDQSTVLPKVFGIPVFDYPQRPWIMLHEDLWSALIAADIKRYVAGFSYEGNFPSEPVRLSGQYKHYTAYAKVERRDTQHFIEVYGEIIEEGKALYWLVRAGNILPCIPTGNPQVDCDSFISLLRCLTNLGFRRLEESYSNLRQFARHNFALRH